MRYLPCGLGLPRMFRMNTTQASAQPPEVDATQARLDAALGAEVRALRARKGWSQEVLAARIGYNKKTVTRLERGERAMTIAQLYRICRVFGIRPSALIDAAEQEVGIQ